MDGPGSSRATTSSTVSTTAPNVQNGNRSRRNRVRSSCRHGRLSNDRASRLPATKNMAGMDATNQLIATAARVCQTMTRTRATARTVSRKPSRGAPRPLPVAGRFGDVGVPATVTSPLGSVVPSIGRSAADPAGRSRTAVTTRSP